MSERETTPECATGMAPPPAPVTQGPQEAMPVPTPSASMPPLAPLLTRIRRKLGLYHPDSLFPADPLLRRPLDLSPRPPLLLRFIHALNPVNLSRNIPGPIFQKEVWVSGRKAGTYWGRGLYAMGMLGLVTLVFLTATSERNLGGAAHQLQSAQTIAPFVFTAIIIFQYLALTLAGCVLGAPTICEEKRAGTLGSLLTTPLKAWQIVLGKTSAFFIQVLILAVIATPLLLAIRVFGGLTAEAVLATTALSLSTALLGGLFGLFNSIGSKRTPAAILGALVSVVAANAIVPLVFLIMIWKHIGSPSWTFPPYASAPWALFYVIGSQFGIPVPERIIHNAWISSTLYNLGLAALLLVVSSWRLRKTMMKEAQGGSQIPKGKKSSRSRPAPATEDVPSASQASPAPDTAGEPHPASPGAPLTTPVTKKKRRVYDHATRTVSDRPVLWRELRQSAFRSRTMLIINTAVFAGLFTALYYYAGLGEDSLHFTIAIIAALAVTCIAAVGATSGISGEREGRTWEALLTTPLSARQIILGKFMGALRRQWFIPALIGAHLAISALYNAFTLEGFPLWAIPYVAAILTAPMIALSGTGVLFSLVCRKSTTASVCNLGLALLVWLVMPILTSILTSISGFGPGGRDLLSTMCIVNPVPMMYCAVEAGLEHRFNLFAWNGVGPAFFTIAIAGHWLLLTGVGVGAAYLASSILAARSGRRT